LKYCLVKVEACLRYLLLGEQIANRKVKVQLSPVLIRPIDLTVKVLHRMCAILLWKREKR
jgi:hypothetical protein